MTHYLQVRDADGQRQRIPAQAIIEAAPKAAAKMLRKGARLNNAADAEAAILAYLGSAQRERFGVLFLDCRNRVLSWRIMFEGTLDSCMVYPREIARAALELNAAAVILAHNHPSGVAEPSQADHVITQRIRKALELFDIRVLDHIIAAGGETTSLARLGGL